MVIGSVSHVRSHSVRWCSPSIRSRCTKWPHAGNETRPHTSSPLKARSRILEGKRRVLDNENLSTGVLAMVILSKLVVQLPAKYYARIGEITFRWATLEFQLQEIIWLVMGLDNKQGRVMTVGMDVTPLVAIFKNLTNRWIDNPTYRQEVNSIGNSIKKLKSWRNAIVHGIWCETISKPHRVDLHHLYEPHQRLMPEATHLTPSELSAIAADLGHLNARLEALRLALKADLEVQGRPK